MDLAALRYIFFGDESDDFLGSSQDPYTHWIRESINLGASEKTLMEQLEIIEYWMYCENVWYSAILCVLDKLPEGEHPNFRYYVKRRKSQADGTDFPDHDDYIRRVYFA